MRRLIFLASAMTATFALISGVTAISAEPEATPKVIGADHPVFLGSMTVTATPL